MDKRRRLRVVLILLGFRSLMTVLIAVAIAVMTASSDIFDDDWRMAVLAPVPVFAVPLQKVSADSVGVGSALLRTGSSHRFVIFTSTLMMLLGECVSLNGCRGPHFSSAL